jgi:hypothetical protein
MAGSRVDVAQRDGDIHEQVPRALASRQGAWGELVGTYQRS